MNQRHSQAEKLKHNKQIETLFSDGKTIGQFPIRLFHLAVIPKNKAELTLVGVSVSKRNFKKAVDRNKIKRLLREAYRKNKYLVNDPEGSRYWLMLVYVGKEIPDLKTVEIAITKALKKLKNLKKIKN